MASLLMISVGAMDLFRLVIVTDSKQIKRYCVSQTMIAVDRRRRAAQGFHCHQHPASNSILSH